MKREKYKPNKLAQEYADKNQSYWEKRAFSYSELNQHQLSHAQNLVWKAFIDQNIQQHFKHDKNLKRSAIKVLDIGTGPGFLAIILAQLGYHVTAVDYTLNMLEEAKSNAGLFRDKIEFFQMNAEELSFPDESFDVIVSRKLTWNLLRPVLAYEQWTRVLKTGGLLLNFDANWYHYLFDAKAQEARLIDREHVRMSGVEDDTAGTDTQTMEALAKKAPLSQRKRPEWDLAVLSHMGLRVSADTQIYKQLWTMDEWINNASTPLFVIKAQKTSCTAKTSISCFVDASYSTISSAPGDSAFNDKRGGLLA